MNAALPRPEWLGRVPYRGALEAQRARREAILARSAPEAIWLLEHDPVITTGRRVVDDLPDANALAAAGVDLVPTERGGLATWHGPGQLVGYPILTLPSPVDVVAHVRRIEGMLINVCADLGVVTDRVSGRSGVWVPADERGPERKVAAIGIRVSEGVTMHGFALNCDNDLAWFDRIVPCGIRDASVTTLSQELGRDVTVSEVLPLITARLRELVSTGAP